MTVDVALHTASEQQELIHMTHIAKVIQHGCSTYISSFTTQWIQASLTLLLTRGQKE